MLTFFINEPPFILLCAFRAPQEAAKAIWGSLLTHGPFFAKAEARQKKRLSANAVRESRFFFSLKRSKAFAALPAIGRVGVVDFAASGAFFAKGFAAIVAKKGPRLILGAAVRADKPFLNRFLPFNRLSHPGDGFREFLARSVKHIVGHVLGHRSGLPRRIIRERMKIAEHQAGNANEQEGRPNEKRPKIGGHAKTAHRPEEIDQANDDENKAQTRANETDDAQDQFGFPVILERVFLTHMQAPPKKRQPHYSLIAMKRKSGK
jgi:hypothetical protein